MTLEELKELVAGGEGDRVEFKETTGQRSEAGRAAAVRELTGGA